MTPEFENVYTSIPWLSNGGTDLRGWVLQITHPVALEFSGDDVLRQPGIRTENRLQISQRTERIHTRAFEVFVRTDCDSAKALLEIVQNTESACVGTLSLLPPIGVAFDAEVIAVGTLVSLNAAKGSVELRFAGGYPAADKPICRDASEIAGFEMLPGHSFLPQVFGRCGLPLLPLFAIESAMSLDAFPADAKTLTLTAVTDWPQTGTVQIDDEVMTYRAISADGKTIGSAQYPLLRIQARAHERNATVVLLPGADMDWCAADHEAEILEVRAESRDGDIIHDGIEAHEDLDGIEATLWRMEKLPLLRTLSRFAVSGSSKLDALSWVLDSSTNVLDPIDLFHLAGQSRGTVFTTTRRVLSAKYTRDLSLAQNRFDKIEDAELSFEFSDTPFWGVNTRLRVTVEKGSASVQADFDRDGVLHEFIAQGTVSTSKRTTGGGALRRLRAAFEGVKTIGTWSDPGNAIDGNFDSATSISTSLPCAIAGRFATARPEALLTVVSVKLLAMVANTGGTSLAGSLSVNVAGKLSRAAQFSVEAGNSEIVSLVIELPGNVDATDLFSADTVYSVSFPDGGDGISIGGIWLEVDALDRISDESISSVIAATPITVKFDARLDYNVARLNVLSLLPPGYEWQFFSMIGISPKVTIELINPPAVDNWAVYLRNLHWNWTTFPATRVRPTTQLWVVVEGRRTRAGGTANPALVVRDLLRQPGLGNLPEELVNESAFAALAVVPDERSMAFAAAIAEDTSLGTMIGRALAESALVLHQQGNVWTLTAAPLDVDGEVVPLISHDDVIEQSGAQSVVAMRQGAEGGVSIRDRDDQPLFRAAGRSALTVDATWLTGDGSALSRFLSARRFPRSNELVLFADARWVQVPAGARIGIGGLGEIEQANRQGEVGVMEYADGHCRMILAQVCETRSFFETEHSLLETSKHSSSLRVYLQGRVVAALDDAGNLSLRGELKEGALEDGFTSSVILTEEDRLRFSYATGGSLSAAVAFTASGDLLTTVPFVERATFANSATMAVAEMRAGESVLGGKWPGAAAMKLDLSGVRIRGALKTKQLF